MKTLLKVLAVAALAWAAVSIEARADDRCSWAALTVGSKHLGKSSSGKDYNEQNWGLGREDCYGKVFGIPVRGAAGFYRNSDRIDSFYFGGSATFIELWQVKGGLAAVLVSGYELDPVKAVFPVASIEGERLGVNLSYFPKTKNNVAAVGFQIKWRWR